jgi:hypothetical protein
MQALRVGASVGSVLMGPDARDLRDDQPTPCYSGHQLEELTLDLPPGRDVIRLPPDTQLGDEAIQYSSHWTRDGQHIVLHRELRTSFSQPVCDGTLRKQAFAMLETIRRDETMPMVLAPAPERTP